MKNMLLIVLLFSSYFSIDAMQANISSSPRKYLIPLDDEFNYLTDSPPRSSRSSRSERVRELAYINLEDKQKKTSKIFEIKKNLIIKAKANEDFALILPVDAIPFQSGDYLQWKLSKEPTKIELITHVFGNPNDPSDDSIALIFMGKSKGSEELLFTKETVDGEHETRTVQVAVE